MLKVWKYNIKVLTYTNTHITQSIITTIYISLSLRAWCSTYAPQVNIWEVIIDSSSLVLPMLTQYKFIKFWYNKWWLFFDSIIPHIILSLHWSNTCSIMIIDLSIFDWFHNDVSVLYSLTDLISIEIKSWRIYTANNTVCK